MYVAEMRTCEDAHMRLLWRRLRVWSQRYAQRGNVTTCRMSGPQVSARRFGYARKRTLMLSPNLARNVMLILKGQS